MKLNFRFYFLYNVIFNALIQMYNLKPNTMSWTIYLSKIEHASPVFQIYDSVRTRDPSIFGKIHPIKSDVSLPDLGLSAEDRATLREKVNIVFHVAATVRFNEPLDVAVNMNTKGTARIIKLCKELKHVISIIHVSTAYSNTNLSEIDEKVYT